MVQTPHHKSASTAQLTSYLQQRQQTINWLNAHNYPALPVAPLQEPYRSGNHKIICQNRGKGIWSHCPLSATLGPIPLFTGKNPSYLDSSGKPHLVNHRQYQNQRPSADNLTQWFAHPLNGVGTLGGWNNTVWLDFDVKQFAGEENCTQAVTKIIENPALGNTFLERTHSGGWRIGIRVKQKPSFTNFALTPGGAHVGEALFEGRFTVLAPTVGPSGVPYQSLSRVQPVDVESLESIGIYSTKMVTQQPPHQGATPKPVSSTPGSIPLEMLGNSSSREILKGANPTGDRSEALATALQEWYGWANWGRDNAIAIHGDVETLAHYAGGQLGIDSDRINRILKTIEPAACHPAALHRGGEESCWKRIYRFDKASFDAKCPAHIKDSIKREWSLRSHNGGNSSSKRHGESETSNKGDGEKSNIPLATVQALVSEILSHDLSPPALTEAFQELAHSTNWQLRSIRDLAAELESDWDKQDSRSERSKEVKQLEQYKTRSLNLKRYLPLSIAHPMMQMALWLGAPSAALLTGLLPTFASCNHPATRVVVKRCIGFIEPLIIYSGLVTESGQRKSPMLNVIIEALRELQQEEEERFRLDEQAYNQELEQWEAAKDSMPQQQWQDAKPTPPTPVREFYLDKTTIEAIDKIKCSQPDTAILWVKDELSALFGSYGAYKNGRGEDKESVLSSWNGRGVKKNLKGGERVSLLRDSMSIVGAIQNTALQKRMGNFDDDQGEWGRFLWALLPLKALRLPTDDTIFQLAFLKDLYARARQLNPQEYKFAFDAQAMYDNFHWRLENRRVSHPQPGMRAAIAKMEGYTARLALALHLIWELEAGKTEPSLFIPRARVEAAIELAEFYLSQVTLIHSQGAAALGEGGLSHRLSAMLTKLQQFGELTARKLQAAISWLRKEAPGKLRADLIELANLGYGRLIGQGNRLKLVLNTSTVDKTVEPTADSGDNSQAVDSTEISQLAVDSADSADTNLRHDELPKLSTDDETQQHQHLNSCSQIPDKPSLLAADDLSADASTVDEDDEREPDNHPPGGGVLLPSSHEENLGVGGWKDCLEDKEEKKDLKDLGNKEESSGQPHGSSSLEQPSPTLAQLQSLLLGCRTFVELSTITQGKLQAQAKLAYSMMSQSQQLQIDGLKAATFNQPIYKYRGTTLRENGLELKTGALVYKPVGSTQTSFFACVCSISAKPQDIDKPFYVNPQLLVKVPPIAPPPLGEQLGFV